MKRDLNLIRRILLFVEADQTRPRLHDGWCEGIKVDFSDTSPYVMSHHILLLDKAGLVEMRLPTHGEIPKIMRLTWEGYDYLDEIRNQETKT